MKINLYKINLDNTYGGIEESHSDIDIDIKDYTAPKGYTFDAPTNETDVWNGVAWVAPYVPTLEEVKALKKDEIEISFDEHVSGSFVCSFGYPMQFDKGDSLLMEGAIQLIEATGGTVGYITDAEDVTHYDVSVANMRTVKIEMLSKYADAHAKKQILRAQIDSATTVEAVQAIAWGVE